MHVPARGSARLPLTPGLPENGGQGQVQDEKGIRKIDVVAGALLDVPPTPWHEFANVGDTTIQFVVVEKKYQVVPPVSQAACPKETIGRAQ